MANRICSIEGCGRKHAAHGWCKNHYALARRNGAPEKVKVRGTCSVEACDGLRYGHGLCVKHWRDQRDRRPCSIDGCDGPEEARRWCSKHYNRWKKHGDPLYEWTPAPCSVTDCQRPAKALTFCGKHYLRVLKRGDPLFEFEYTTKPPTPCAIDDCSEDASSRGWCAAHYGRWRNHGSPTARYPWEIVDGRRICPRCKVDTLLADWKQIWCTDCTREYRRHKGHERRARLARTMVGEPFTRAQVLERDGWVCQLCEGVIDPAILYPDPMSPSLDHRVPLSKGGAHSFENGQASHLVCNLRKSARVESVLNPQAEC